MKGNEQNGTWDIDVQACSATDCTGLIPAPPRTEGEAESYEELYPYVTKAIPLNNDIRSENN